MTTVTKVDVQFEGPTLYVTKITAIGDVDSLDVTVVDASGLTSVDGGGKGSPAGDSYPVLLEATWSINSFFDHVKLYYNDEGDDEVILVMSGDGSYNARGFGGGDVNSKFTASPILEADYDVEADFVVSSDADTASSADITLVFKKRKR